MSNDAAYTYSPQPRLLEAFARGEVTLGGLAEAGWFTVGWLRPDGSPLAGSVFDSYRNFVEGRWNDEHGSWDVLRSP